jgi:hypothetical protein
MRRQTDIQWHSLCTGPGRNCSLNSKEQEVASGRESERTRHRPYRSRFERSALTLFGQLQLLSCFTVAIFAAWRESARAWICTESAAWCACSTWRFPLGLGRQPDASGRRRRVALPPRIVSSSDDAPTWCVVDEWMEDRVPDECTRFVVGSNSVCASLKSPRRVRPHDEQGARHMQRRCVVTNSQGTVGG